MEELIGRKIVGTRQMTPEEIKFEGWDRGTTLLLLDDGSIIYPSQDDEGNGCGALFGRKGDKAFRIGYQDAYGALNHSMSVEGKDGNWHCVKCGRIKDDSEDDCECTFSEPKKKGEH